MNVAIVLSLCCIALPTRSFADVKEALAAQERGDYQAARKEFEALAERGDAKAMVDLGRMYHVGEGVKRDYAKAMDWYLKAFKKGNGTAYNNIGVMYRDGQGVQTNQQVAYALFYIIHKRSLGTEDDQWRAGRNLTRLAEAMAEANQKQIYELLDWPEEYVLRFVEGRGKRTDKDEALRKSKKRSTLKDLAKL